MNLQTGAFGDPTNLKTLILFWTKMELLHYPGAGDTKTYLEQEYQQQQAMMQQQMAMQQQQMQIEARRPRTGELRQGADETAALSQSAGGALAAEAAAAMPRGGKPDRTAGLTTRS